MSSHNPSHGTKVTDPKASSIEEGAGTVAPDSLAAESTKFSENRNIHSGEGNPASRDISGASRLDAAPDAESRTAQEDWAEEKKLSTYPDAVGGQAKGLAVENTTGSSTTGGASSNAGTAPSYVANQYMKDTSGPHGKNLTEGGFESDDKNNASFNADIGSKDDPGRMAELQFQNRNSKAAGTAGMPGQQGSTDEGQYKNLDSETSA